ncbi:hypothetical protein FBY06_12291 [Pseudomonas sp. SJZ085]|uniref:hypothetical protein n=1 Tax=unclassified Pseudomonas TaxID=196821 RepID=UPI001199DBCD|nr:MULTISPECIES: hypothetical protein [unclassified Pseudomonas]TWC15728.1 hypothetical protein FBX99_12291 [Pseudomonas sp. SJZ074]TWC34004.1 hypothetical protein FBY06_12291 [Pseudomonas sp. SJZ085]
MHSIAPYSLRCFNPYSDPSKGEDRYAVLDKIGQFDMYQLFKAFIEAQGDKFKIVETTQQVYRFHGMKFYDDKREMVGWFEAGYYGVKNNIIDIETGNVDFEKLQNNAEIIRHYVRFYIPNGFDEGVALLHNYKGNGIKTLLHDLLREHFNKVTKRTFQMNPLAYKKAFKIWEEAVTKEIKLTKFMGMPDITDQLTRLGHKEQQLIVKPPSRGKLGKLKDFFKPGTEEYEVVEFLRPHCAQIKAVAELDGKKRTFTIGRPAEEQICEIIVDEDEVVMVAGNPEPESLHKWCTSLLQEFVGYIYPGLKVKI